MKAVFTLTFIYFHKSIQTEEVENVMGEEQNQHTQSISIT
jgi:hypothetical protein